MPSVEGFCGIKRLRRSGKEEDSVFSFSYERYEMMGGVGETWLFPAFLKKKVSKASNMKQLQAVPWVVTMLKRERKRRNNVKFLETSQG